MDSGLNEMIVNCLSDCHRENVNILSRYGDATRSVSKNGSCSQESTDISRCIYRRPCRGFPYSDLEVQLIRPDHSRSRKFTIPFRSQSTFAKSESRLRSQQEGPDGCDRRAQAAEEHL